MQKIFGKEIAGGIIENLRKLDTPKKIFAVVQVGNDPASARFIEKKKEAALGIGIDMRVYKLDDKLSQDKLREEVGKISRQKSVGGVIVQLPLPHGINKFYVLNAIPPEKDADVLSERTLGSFYNGRSKVLPPAVGTIAAMWKSLGLEGKIKKAAVVGPGFLVGKPAITWLVGRVKNIHIIDEGGDINAVRDADLIISGAGAPGIIDGAAIREGAVVIDFGYGTKDGKMAGDFLPPTEDKNKSGFYTPTPGGTGPVLVAKLLENFFILNQNE